MTIFVNAQYPRTVGAQNGAIGLGTPWQAAKQPESAERTDFNRNANP